MKQASSTTSLVSLDTTQSTKKAKKMYKKSPDAPKRFKSAYICYVTEKMEEARVNEPSESKATDIMKSLAIKWRDLPSDERQKYVLMAETDKARYFSEMATYDGPMQVLNKRAKKPDDAPKRAMSAFLSFSQSMRQEVRLKYPNLKNMELSSLLAQMWRDASEEVKRPHTERESREREKYHEEMTKWKEEEAVRLEREKHALAESGLIGDSIVGDIPFGYPSPMFSQLLADNPGGDDVRTADDDDYDNEEDNFVGKMVTGDTTDGTYPRMLATSSSSSSLTTAYDGSDGSRDFKDPRSLSTSSKKRRSKHKKSSSHTNSRNSALTYDGWQSGFAAIAAASANHTSQAMGNLGVYFNFPWLMQGAQGAMLHQHHQQQTLSTSGLGSMNESRSMTNVADIRDGMMAPPAMGLPLDGSQRNGQEKGHSDTADERSDGNGGSTQPPPQKQQRQYNYQLSNFQAYLLQQQQYQHQQYAQLAQHYQNQYQHQLQQQAQPRPKKEKREKRRQENAQEIQSCGSEGMVNTNALPHGYEDCDITEFFFDRDAPLSPLLVDVDDGESVEAVPAVAAANKQSMEEAQQQQQRMLLWQQQWEQQQIQAQSAMMAQQRAKQFYRGAPSSSDTLASYASHASAQSAVTSVASYSSASSSASSFDFDLVNLCNEPPTHNTAGNGQQCVSRPQMLQGSARYHADESVHLTVSPPLVKMEADTALPYPPGCNADDAISVAQALRYVHQAARGLVNVTDDVQNDEHGDVESRKRALSTITEYSSAINF